MAPDRLAVARFHVPAKPAGSPLRPDHDALNTKDAIAHPFFSPLMHYNMPGHNKFLLPMGGGAAPGQSFSSGTARCQLAFRITTSPRTFRAGNHRPAWLILTRTRPTPESNPHPSSLGLSRPRASGLLVPLRPHFPGPFATRFLIALSLGIGINTAGPQAAEIGPAPARELTAVHPATSSEPARPSQLPFLPSLVPTLSGFSRIQHTWCDLDAQVRYASFRSPQQRELLQIAQEKVTARHGTAYGSYWAKQAAWNGYDSLAGILALSSYGKREDFVRCGYSRFLCNDRLACPRCCHRLLRGPLLDEFSNAFTAASEVFFIVVSLSVDPDETHRLIFRDIDESDLHQIRGRGVVQPCIPEHYGTDFITADDLLRCRLLWGFFIEAIRELTGSKPGQPFIGVVGGPELAVRLHPLRVLPHANFIVWSAGFCIEDARKLRKSIRDKMCNSRRIHDGLYPALACYRLAGAEDLGRVLGYMCKPIDLAGDYINAAERVSFETSAMEALNTETNLFLKHLPLVFARLPRIGRYGQCSASHRSYFGHVTEWRKAKRQRDAERRKAGCWGQSEPRWRDPATWQPGRSALENWQAFVTQELTRPKQARHSRFHYWRRAYEPKTPFGILHRMQEWGMPRFPRAKQPQS